LAGIGTKAERGKGSEKEGETKARNAAVQKSGFLNMRDKVKR
jgi:hypothetical protein